MAVGDVKQVVLKAGSQSYSPAAGVNEIIVGGTFINNSNANCLLQMKLSSNSQWVQSYVLAGGRITTLDTVGVLGTGGAGSENIKGIMLTPDTEIRISTTASVAAFLTLREVQAGA